MHLLSVRPAAVSLSSSQCHVSLREPAWTGASGFLHRKSQPIYGPPPGHHERSLQQPSDQHLPARLPGGRLPLRATVRTHLPRRGFLPVLHRASRTGSGESAGVSVQQGPVAEVSSAPNRDDHHKARTVGARRCRAALFSIFVSIAREKNAMRSLLLSSSSSTTSLLLLSR